VKKREWRAAIRIKEDRLGGTREKEFTKKREKSGGERETHWIENTIKPESPLPKKKKKSIRQNQKEKQQQREGGGKEEKIRKGEKVLIWVLGRCFERKGSSGGQQMVGYVWLDSERVTKERSGGKEKMASHHKTGGKEPYQSKGKKNQRGRVRKPNRKNAGREYKQQRTVKRGRGQKKRALLWVIFEEKKKADRCVKRWVVRGVPAKSKRQKREKNRKWILSKSRCPRISNTNHTMEERVRGTLSEGPNYCWGAGFGECQNRSPAAAAKE